MRTNRDGDFGFDGFDGGEERRFYSSESAWDGNDYIASDDFDYYDENEVDVPDYDDRTLLSCSPANEGYYRAMLSRPALGREESIRLCETASRERLVFHGSALKFPRVISRAVDVLIEQFCSKKGSEAKRGNFDETVQKIRDVERLNERDFRRATDPTLSSRTRAAAVRRLDCRRKETAALIDALVCDFKLELSEKFFLDALDDLSELVARAVRLQAQIDSVGVDTREGAELVAELDAILLDVLETPESFSRIVQKMKMSARALKAARDALFCGHFRLVLSYVNWRCHSRPDLRDDLVGEGILGLQKAIDGFDYTRGVAFSTYAVNWIRQSVDRGYAKHKSVVYVPIKASASFWKAEYALERKLGRTPTMEELVAEIGAPVGEIMKTARASCGYVSINQDDDGDDRKASGYEPQSYEESASDRFEAKEIHTILERLIHSSLLDDRERAILLGRFPLFGGEEKTFQELADEFAISRERVRQILCVALGKLGGSRLVSGFDD
ncbi:MAG: sigma-70 family RNA polymerase sigma factor [Thermoguttaceae bacterium]|nr:sigma-70 family RNA polymerase sigma factor [Thermoguttaceae bacterium]